MTINLKIESKMHYSLINWVYYIYSQPKSKVIIKYKEIEIEREMGQKIIIIIVGVVRDTNLWIEKCWIRKLRRKEQI